MNPALATPPHLGTAAECFLPILDDLRRVDEVLRERLNSDAPYVDELLRYVADLGGKRLRPALLLLAAKASRDVQPAHHVLAAVVEMIHTATLVHDDVLDEAEERRHRPTVHRRWGVKTAILLGDHLFSRAFHLASTVGDAETCEIIGRSTNIVCEGELWQNGESGKWEMPEEDYLTMIGQKTAELCACCCELGARHAGASVEVVEALRRYGNYLGIAFQIADDVLDLTGRSELTGKSLGTDLHLGKPTLPLIHWLARMSPGERRAKIRGLVDATAKNGDGRDLRGDIGRGIASSGAVDYALARARAFAESARGELEQLAPSDAKDSLTRLCQFVVARGN